MMNTIFKIWITLALGALVWLSYTDHKSQNKTVSAPEYTPSLTIPAGHEPSKHRAYVPETPKSIVSKPVKTPKKAVKAKPTDEKIKAAKKAQLAALENRFPEFPAVLNENRWISSTAGLTACQSRPEETYIFGAPPSTREDIACELRISAPNPTYQCQTKKGRKQRSYTVKSGHNYLEAYTLSRPHITLIDVKRPSRKISLKLCKKGNV